MLHRKTYLSSQSIAAFLVLLLAVPALAAGPQAAAAPGISIDNFGKVNDTYYRGAQPVAGDYHDLASLGVKLVIDLQRDFEPGEEAAATAAGLKFHRIPMTTQDRPDPAAVAEFLSLVNDPGNQPVYVHCAGGRHRTGTMTAIYRITHDGWTADRAYAEMKQFEFGKGFGHGALKTFVYDYYSRLARPAAAGGQQ